MGTKRVGWARIRSLINENQNELFHAKVATKSVTSDTTLTTSDSGKVILMGQNGVDITLPAATAGMSFKIIQTADYATAVCTVTAAAGDYMAGGAVSLDTNHGNTANGSSNIVATFGTAVLAGDYIDLVSDGTVWLVSGMSTAKTNGIVFSDS
jgi:hypothetical protein